MKSCWGNTKKESWNILYFPKFCSCNTNSGNIVMEALFYNLSMCVVVPLHLKNNMTAEYAVRCQSNILPDYIYDKTLLDVLAIGWGLSTFISNLLNLPPCLVCCLLYISAMHKLLRIFLNFCWRNSDENSSPLAQDSLLLSTYLFCL